MVTESREVNIEERSLSAWYVSYTLTRMALQQDIVGDGIQR